MAERLVADIGGTRTRIGLAGATGLLSGSVRHFANADFASPAALLAAYLEAVNPGPVAALCAAVAGPVQDGRARLTNRDWVFEADTLRAVTGAGRIHLLNDLQAQGCALDDLPAGDVTGLVAGTSDPAGPRLVLGLGTGCNAAAVHRLGRGLFVPPAEAGHTALPDIAEMRALYDHLRRSHPHLPVEAALSGPGLSNIHEWLTGTRLGPDRIIALQPAVTLQTFACLLGAVAGDLCLAHMATGGLFLIGGTARATAPWLRGPDFLGRFTARGPYAGIMRRIPVALVTDDSAALRGCARYLRQALE